MIDRGRIDEPSSCHLCGNTMSMELVHNRCLFTDKQMIRLQVRSVFFVVHAVCMMPLRRGVQEGAGGWGVGAQIGWFTLCYFRLSLSEADASMPLERGEP